MATRANLTVDFNDLLGAEVSRISARLVTNLPSGAAVMDETNKTVNLGSGKVDVGQDGKATMSLILTDSTDLNISANTLQYRLFVEAAVGGDRVKFDSGWFAFTAAADITELDLQQPALIPSGPGGSALIVVNGGTVDLDDTKPDGYLIGYRVTAPTTIEGAVFEPGSYIFERDSGVTSGWTFRTVAAGEEVTVTPDTTAPTTPTLTVNNSASTQLVATFSGGTDNVAVTQYRTRIDGGAWTVGASPRTFTGLAASTSYTIDAQAGDAAGNWSPSATWTGSTAAALPSVDYTSYDSVVTTDSPTYAVQLDGSARITSGSVTTAGTVTFDAVGATAPTASDYIEVAGTGTMGTAGNPIAACTLECVIWVVSHDATTRYIGGLVNTNLVLMGTNQPAAAIKVTAAGSATVPIGRAVHIAGTYDGTTTRIYVDGVETGTAAGSGSITNNTSTLRVGWGTTGALGTNVKIGRYAYYPRALSALEVADHADAL